MDERTRIYLKDSHTPWKPKRLALSPWETGLLSNFTVGRVVILIEIQIKQAIGKKNDSG